MDGLRENLVPHWLPQVHLTLVSMESTGVYWRPVWNLLEGQFELLLANATHVKNVPGRKTDVKDSEWIAQLMQHGLLKPSFVPDTVLRDLRELSRDRTSWVAERSRLKNRILEDANIKLGSVASDILGKSGRAMRWKHYGAESVAYIVSVCNNSCSESILLMSRLQSWKPKSKNRMPPWKKPSLC